MYTPKDINAFIFWVKRRHPKIRPHMEDDLEWWNEGLDLIRSGRFGLAGNKFQKLMLSQPNHPDGYEGLAYVCVKTARIGEARILMDHAVTLTASLVAAGESDREMLDMRKEFQERLHNHMEGSKEEIKLRWC